MKARESIEILFNVIRKRSTHKHVTFEAELVVRESTCAPRVSENSDV